MQNLGNGLKMSPQVVAHTVPYAHCKDSIWIFLRKTLSKPYNFPSDNSSGAFSLSEGACPRSFHGCSHADTQRWEVTDTDRSSSGRWELRTVQGVFATVMQELGIIVQWDCVTDPTRDPGPRPTSAVKTMPRPRVTYRYNHSIDGSCIGRAQLALIQHSKNWRWLSLLFYEKKEAQNGQ